MRFAFGVSLVAMLAACPVTQPAPVGPHAPGSAEQVARPPITWARAATPADVPSTPPPPGVWRVHLIDVGTGLAILVQGADFTLLYDAGTNDPDETPDRVVAYLSAALGPSGDEQCVGEGAPTAARRRIDHVVLSHPHLDHASALDLVLHCYEVGDVWDSGRVNEAVFYRDFLYAVSEATGTTYHTASPPPDDRRISVKGIDVTIPPAVAWTTFSEGDEVALGAGARMTLLHAEAKASDDPNGNSIVVAVDLGGARLLLTGDAESGERADPSEPIGGVEAHVVEQFPALVDADILQVGHHGSKTSSRRAFLDAVSPSLALVSAGPKLYSKTRLPDAEVIAALEAVGATVLRTDEHDASCPTSPRIGADHGPGGCDAWVVTIGPAP